MSIESLYANALAGAAPWTARVAALGESLLIRVRRGEGQIALVPIGLALAADADVTLLAAVAISFLTALYAFNDLCDCEQDAADPQRDDTHAIFLLQNRGALLRDNLLLVALLLGIAFAALGTLAALAMLVVFLVNTVYSLWLKGSGGCDLVLAPIWGGGFAAMAGTTDPFVLGLVGAMTTVCHLFQVRRDVPADAANRVRTVLVAAPGLGRFVVAACCAAMALLTGLLIGPLAGASAVIPFALFVSPLHNQLGWLAAKLWFAAVFGYVLLYPGGAHG